MGLRDLKKARTRKLISDVARDLFIERGYEAVTVADIAAKAEVAVTTLFNYFPTKESTFFDLEDELEVEIIAAIRDREKDQSVLDALHKYFLRSKLFNPPQKKTAAQFIKLVTDTPELALYFRGLWDRYVKSLAKEVQRETKASKLEAEGLANLILQGVSHACHSSSPKDSLSNAFRCLQHGWGK